MARSKIDPFEVMTQKRTEIAAAFKEKNVYTKQEVAAIFKRHKEDWELPSKTTISNFLEFLMIEGILLEEIHIKRPHGRTSYRFVNERTTAFEVALSLNKGSYLSHYSALYIHGLTDNIPKKIYTNKEQKKIGHFQERKELSQDAIDWAFNRPMRKTNQIATFVLDRKKYQVYMLNGKDHGRFGVIKAHFEDGTSFYVTNVERTLIDCLVRPDYAGGVQQVFQAFQAAKGLVSVNDLKRTLIKMDFVYPYHQALGLYLEKAGFTETGLKIIESMGIDYDFYLTYQMGAKDFSERWRVYYPKGMFN